MAGVGSVHRGVRYGSTDGLAAGLAPVLSAAVAEGTEVAVALDEATADAVRGRLGADADAVAFVDPSRPAVVDAFQLAARRAEIVRAAADRGRRSLFVGQNQPALGLDDAVWLRLEAALSTACAELPVTLLCPYRVDAEGAEPTTLRAVHAELTHSDLREVEANSEAKAPAELVAGLPDAALPCLGAPRLALGFARSGLGEVRSCASDLARAAGFDRDACEDLVYAVNEIVTNGVEHGAGTGRLEAWVDGRTVVCDVVDSGHLVQAFPGVLPPARGQARGRGLWLARMLCEDVVVHRDDDGTRVRLTMTG